jgi:hypothetical protein
VEVADNEEMVQQTDSLLFSLDNSLEYVKNRLKAYLEAKQTKQDHVEFSRENYIKIFGEEEKVDTPIGEVLIARNQYKKLIEENRTGWLGAWGQTLKDPDLIYEANPTKYVFVKSFKRSKCDGVRTYFSVVAEKGNNLTKYSITIHQRSIGRALKELKDARDILYPAVRSQHADLTDAVNSLSSTSTNLSSP